MTPEQEILADGMAQVEAISLGVTDSLDMIGVFPVDLRAFETFGPAQRIASTAMLKQVEQLEDALARAFRTILKMLGQSIRGLYAYDIANHMIALDILDDADAWVAVVKLRNQLVHEYPFGAAERFDRVSQAYAALPLLLDASRRVATYVRSRGWLNP